MVALDAKGKNEWQFRRSLQNVFCEGSAPVIYEDLLEKKIYGSERLTGKELWNTDFTTFIASRPVAARGTISISYRDGSLQAVNPDSGKQLWNFTIQSHYDID